MSNEKNLPYAVVCGGVNIDIGAHSFAPLRDRDSNPGRVELSLGGVGRNIAHNMRLLGVPTYLLTAVGGDTSGSEFDQMARLSAMTGIPIPKNLAGLQGKPERHTGVINKEDMLDYVLHL